MAHLLRDILRLFRNNFTKLVMEETRSGSSLGVPIAIVIAAALIAGAIILTGQSSGSATPTVGGVDTQAAVNQAVQEASEPRVLPISEDDHIRGNPNAPIVLVEYSDYDCPFCKNFHETMNRIMSEYGADGKVAWVYRHFPLAQLHPNAQRIAEASECVAELGGNDAFWDFSDLVFAERGTNEPTNINRLSEFAVTVGVDERAFDTCLESGRYQEQIAQDVVEAIEAGGEGTPHTIVMVGDQQGVINGAQPYEVVKQIIDGLLTQIEGGVAE